MARTSCRGCGPRPDARGPTPLRVPPGALRLQHGVRQRDVVRPGVEHQPPQPLGALAPRGQVSPVQRRQVLAQRTEAGVELLGAELVARRAPLRLDLGQGEQDELARTVPAIGGGRVGHPRSWYSMRTRGSSPRSNAAPRKMATASLPFGPSWRVQPFTYISTNRSAWARSSPRAKVSA